MNLREALENRSRPSKLPVPLLQLDIRAPRRLLRLPRHPSLKHLSRPRNIPQRLLHVDILIPELIHPRQDRHRTVEQVTSMVDIPCLHLRLDVAQPQDHGARVNIEGTLEDGARAGVLLLVELPLRVAHPVVHVDAVAADIVFEFFALAALELVELFEVGKALGGRLEALFLSLEGLAEDLFGAGRVSCGCGRRGGRGYLICWAEAPLFLTRGGPREDSIAVVLTQSSLGVGYGVWLWAIVVEAVLRAVGGGAGDALDPRLENPARAAGPGNRGGGYPPRRSSTPPPSITNITPPPREQLRKKQCLPAAHGQYWPPSGVPCGYASSAVS